MALPGVFCSIVCRFLDERCREAKTMERKSNSISRHYRIWLLIFPKFCTVTAILIEDFHWKKINKVSAVSRPVLFFFAFFFKQMSSHFWNIQVLEHRGNRFPAFVTSSSFCFGFSFRMATLAVGRENDTHTQKKKQKNDDFFHKLVELEEDSFFASRGFAYDETTR